MSVCYLFLICPSPQRIQTCYYPQVYYESGLSVPPLLICFVRSPLINLVCPSPPYRSGLSPQCTSIVIKLHGFSPSVHMYVTFPSPPLCYVRMCFCPHPFVCLYMLLSPTFCLFVCASVPTHLFVRMFSCPHPFVCLNVLLFPPIRDEREAKHPS